MTEPRKTHTLSYPDSRRIHLRFIENDPGMLMTVVCEIRYINQDGTEHCLPYNGLSHPYLSRIGFEQWVNGTNDPNGRFCKHMTHSMAKTHWDHLRRTGWVRVD